MNKILSVKQKSETLLHFSVSKLRVFTCIICLFLMSFPACGYRFEKGTLPLGIKSICITIFENHTAETGIETVFTNDIIDEFTGNTDLVLTSCDRADAVLSGKIDAMTIKTISRGGTHTALERQVKISVSLKLTGSDGNVIRSVKNLTEDEAYFVISDKIGTEQNRRHAVSLISKRAAETGFQHFTNDF
ncbi:LPS assembly lipoprotein LptE [Desulfococcaceae bacterium HSG8]|nr:LPS assembly lipoprotein LptE [Desulfococcaceae bacterium HSG8]